MYHSAPTSEEIVRTLVNKVWDMAETTQSDQPAMLNRLIRFLMDLQEILAFWETKEET